MRWSGRLYARCGATGTVLLVACLWTAAAWAGSGPLQVRRVSPSGDNVPRTQEAVIQFDRAMVPLGHMGRETATLPVSISPDPGCQWRWLNTSELACRLPKQKRFAPATHYTITVGTALEALDGSHLAEPVVRHFTTRLPSVDYSRFQEWTSPVMPVFMVRLDMPVTARQLAGHIGFAGANGDWVAAKVEPFTKKRNGPVWLPVPGHPGAVVVVTHPKPNTPLDAHAKAAAGRRVWKVVPAKPLAAATQYKLHTQPGMRSPLGSLPGKQDEAVGSLLTYGAFTFSGVGCDPSKTGPDIRIKVGENHPPRCQPKSINLLFSAPVPRATLAAIQWQPMPVSRAKLARLWHNYPRWFLRSRDHAHDAKSPDSYPLTFGLAPMQSYTLTVPAGVTDRFGRTLARPVHLTFRTGHRVPFMDPPPHESVLEAGEPTIVPLRFTNLEHLSLAYRRLTAGDLSHGFIAVGHTTENLLERPDLAAREDRIVRGKLGIRSLLDGYSGVVWGDLDWPRAWQPFSFFGEVTPWQVYAKVGHYNTLVWVNRFDNGQPVVGAQVKLLHGPTNDLSQLTLDGKVATTNAEGLAVLPGTASLPGSWFHQWKTTSIITSVPPTMAPWRCCRWTGVSSAPSAAPATTTCGATRRRRTATCVPGR